MTRLVAVKEELAPLPVLTTSRAKRTGGSQNGTEQTKATAQGTGKAEITQIEVEKTSRASRPGGRRKMSKPSKLQEKILTFIGEFMDQHNELPPTVREIQETLSISSTSVVDYNLKALEAKGMILRNKKQSRGITMLSRLQNNRMVAVPFKGLTAAGPALVDRFEVTDESVEIPPYMLAGKGSAGIFALKVKGESMIDALIANEDIVLIRSQANAEVGETVVVSIDKEGENEITLKKWYPEPTQKRVRLQPANTTMEPIYAEMDKVRVLGKLVGVIRTMA